MNDQPKVCYVKIKVLVGKMGDLGMQVGDIWIEL